MSESLAIKWSVKLAREVAPEEADLAPLVVEAWLAGGQSRRDLLQQREMPGGALSAESLPAILPFILSGIGMASPTLSWILTHDNVRDFLGCLKSWLTCLEISEKTRSLRRAKDQQTPRPGAPPEMSVERLEALKSAVQRMCAELRRRGMAEDESEAISYRVLISLLEEPEEGRRFVTEVSAA